MTYKQTVGLAVVAGASVVAAVWVGWSSSNVHPSVVSLATPLSAIPTSVSAGPAESSTVPAAEPTPDEELSIPPLPANATHVPDNYLLKLSAIVRLANADERGINKKRWSRALPIAERLVQAPCDCEQRNWLNHFISMGNDALAGMDESYYHTAVLMQTMARNDQQLADHPETFAR